jgi:hypothetical protein
MQLIIGIHWSKGAYHVNQLVDGVWVDLFPSLVFRSYKAASDEVDATFS